MDASIDAGDDADLAKAGQQLILTAMSESEGQQDDHVNAAKSKALAGQHEAASPGPTEYTLTRNFFALPPEGLPVEVQFDICDNLLFAWLDSHRHFDKEDVVEAGVTLRPGCPDAYAKHVLGPLCSINHLYGHVIHQILMLCTVIEHAPFALVPQGWAFQMDTCYRQEARKLILRSETDYEYQILGRDDWEFYYHGFLEFIASLKQDANYAKLQVLTILLVAPLPTSNDFNGSRGIESFIIEGIIEGMRKLGLKRARVMLIGKEVEEDNDGDEYSTREWNCSNQYVGFDMTKESAEEIADMLTSGGIDWAVWV